MEGSVGWKACHQLNSPPARHGEPSSRLKCWRFDPELSRDLSQEDARARLIGGCLQAYLLLVWGFDSGKRPLLTARLHLCHFLCLGADTWRAQTHRWPLDLKKPFHFFPNIFGCSPMPNGSSGPGNKVLCSSIRQHESLLYCSGPELAY